jgi:hypothetical protein
MNKIPYNKKLALLLAITGLAVFTYGLYYNLSNIFNTNASFTLASLTLVGYVILLIAPIFVRAYYITWILLALAATYLLWVFVAAQ